MKVNDAIIIKAKAFVHDFKSLNSGYNEITKTLKDLGYSASLLYNWTTRMDSEGNAKVSEACVRKLCEISGLSFDEYYVGPVSSKAPKSTQKKVTSSTLKNGIRVTTYSKPQSTKPDPTQVKTSKFALNISSFKTHMEIYRKLLGIHTSTLVDDYGIKNYADIESGKDSLSVSTYFTLCQIFLAEYDKLLSSPLKTAFEDLAKTYNDIYVSIVYFGDTSKKRK